MATKIPFPARCPNEAPNPERMKLNEVAAERLGALGNIAAKDLIGLTVAEVGEKYRHVLDPQWLLFRKVQGVVVKTDPVSGTELPVPFATVHVEDTDCSLLGYFPASSRWSWYFPFKCRREVLTTATTNECGKFCVWIPRWDIDWVVRFRRERICFPIAFERPSIRDILEGLIPPRIPGPIPEDPLIGMRVDRGRFVRLVEESLGSDVARTLDQLHAQATFGASNLPLNAVLDSNAFAQPLPPPMPERLAPETLPVLSGELKQIDPRRFIGPFKRCVDVLVREWQPVVDIPDITFRVTQDTNGDGVEEEIYSEGYFQVRWNASALGDIKIFAKANAVAGSVCGAPRVPCSNEPAIVLAGRMPVINDPTIYDTAHGYALRPNRPHPSGSFGNPLPIQNAASPFYGAFALWGCKNTDPTATHYRVQFQYSNDDGATYTDYTPFVGLTWLLFRLNGGVLERHTPSADAHGWYPIDLPGGPAWLPGENLLLDWPTTVYADGRYRLRLELGTPGGGASSVGGEVAFNIDNSAPNGELTVEWRPAGSGPYKPLAMPCPVVRRGNTPTDIEFRVRLAASARHLRSAEMSAGSCGGGAMTLQSGRTQHWHTAPSNNSELLEAVFRLPASAAEGAYGFGATIVGRAFNPSGGDGGHLKAVPWEYDPSDRHAYRHFAFAVVNAEEE